MSDELNDLNDAGHGGGEVAIGNERPPTPMIFRSVMDYESVDSLRAALSQPPYREISATASVAASSPTLPSSPLPFGACLLNPSPLEQSGNNSNGSGSNNNSNNVDDIPLLCDWQTPHLDLSTSSPQSLEEEVRRLMILKDYSILDSDQEETFERITALASRIFDVPICLVSLVDVGRQWFMSNRGLGDVRETSRQVSFCAHAILSKQEVFVIPETHHDPRFRNNGLVTGPPYIRFYAGAPLISPEGYKLGTFCIIDSKPKPQGLSLNDKQNIRELAAMVMDTMVTRRKEMERIRDEKTRLIACAAHDLLSPLTGVQLNLELLMTDETLKEKLDEHQKELMSTAVKCSEIIERICVRAIESFRGGLVQSHGGRRGGGGSEGEFWEGNDSNHGENDDDEDKKEPDKRLVNIAKLVDNINQVVATYPKQVPLIIEVDENVPPDVISDDLKIFRSVLNYMTNACKQTRTGNIRLRIYVRKAADPATELELDLLPGALVAPKKDVLIMEVHDTGPGVNLEKYPSLFTPLSDGMSSEVQHSKMSNSGLGLYSVATEISSLGGEYGVFPREDLAASNPDHDAPNEMLTAQDVVLNGSVFWFSVPLVVPTPPTSSPTASDDKKSSDTTAQHKRNHPKSQLFSLPPTISAVSKPVETRPTKRFSSDVSMVEDLECSHKPKKQILNHPTSEKNVPVKALARSLSGFDIKDNGGKRQKRVLIIDDSLTIRKSLARCFSRLGFEVDEAENGLQGFKKLKAAAYDLCLLDFLMPIMDGVDVSKKFRAWESLHRLGFHQYIIGMSAHANGKDAELGIKAGMDRFMGKPVPLKTLQALAESKQVSEAGVALDRIHMGSRAAFDLTAMLADNKDDEVRSKSSNSSSMSLSENTVRQSCLIAENHSDPTLQSLQHLVEICGWRVVVVSNGDEALRMLKMLNFGMVFIDGDLPISASIGSAKSGMAVIARFREWEQASRVVRQKNIHLMRDTFSPVMKTLPSGCDGVVQKPLDPSKISSILDNASKETFKGNRDILLRSSSTENPGEPKQELCRILQHD